MSPKALNSTWYKVVGIYTAEFPGTEVPIVYLNDGRPGYVINQWTYSLLEEEISASKLESYLRSICHLYELTMACYGNNPLTTQQSEGLIALFIDAKKYGTDEYCLKHINDHKYEILRNVNLHWEPTNNKNINIYLKGINTFDKWQTVYHTAESLNPYEIHFKNAFEIYHDFKKRVEWDPMIHLHGTRRHESVTHKYEIAPKHQHRRKNKQTAKAKAPKAFPLDSFIKIVEATKNPRDKMLLLLMMGGSLRMSETLHILFPDIEGVDDLGQARVRLEDPEDGNMEWESKGTTSYGTRAKYFEEKWKNTDLPKTNPLRDLKPRVNSIRRNGLHSGWKGQTYSESDGKRALSGNADGRPYETHYVWWIDPRIGAYFYQCYEEYMEKYIYRNPFTHEPNGQKWPYHPWLFIKLNKEEYGMPLTIAGLKKIWNRLLKKNAMSDCGLSWHSLRHLYGYYCANVLHLPIETTQVLMHHSSPESTKVYYTLEKEEISKIITNAYTSAHGAVRINSDTPEPKITFPVGWVNKTLNMTLTFTKGRK